jgi:hypothetical protein
MVEAQPVAGRIAEPRLAPEPGLVGGRTVENDTRGPEPRHRAIEVLALEIHNRSGARAFLLSLLHRERAVAVGALESHVARERIYDEAQSQPPVELGDRGHLAGGKGHLVESHAGPAGAIGVPCAEANRHPGPVRT